MMLSDVVSKEEMRELMERSNLRAAWSVFSTFGVIGSAFAIAAIWPNVLTWFLASLLIGGRILGLAILNHDASHNGLFPSRRINYFLGQWVFGALIFGDFHSYRLGHADHHRLTGTASDPDLFIVDGYPTTIASLRRKFFRDLSGRSGLRDLFFTLRYSTLEKRLPTIMAHAVMFGLLFASGHPEAYVIWWIAYIFVYPAIMRLRAMGEHATVPNSLSRDVRENTRTTVVSPIERLLIAPNYVNFHVEHHLMAGAPGYNLPKMHKMLIERGFYDKHDCITRGYANVIRHCVGTPKTGRKHYAKASYNGMT
jgi:fatty acid desaturase